MSVLMFLNSGGDERRWPSEEAVDRFRASVMAVPVIECGLSGGKSFTATVAVEFRKRQSEDSGNHVRLVLTGCQDPELADQLYRDCGVPVIVVDERRCPEPDNPDSVAVAVSFANAMADEYSRYSNSLRNMPHTTANPLDFDAYVSIVDAFGDGISAVEPVLDAILEQVCGVAERSPMVSADDDKGNGRWTLANTAVVEHGDGAAEEAERLRFTDVVATDYTERVTRTATSFATSFWSHAADRPSNDVDRVLAKCLMDDLRAAADPALVDWSIEQFFMFLNAKFIANRCRRRCSASSIVDTRDTDDGRPSLFQPEIREQCERFLTVGHLMDLMDNASDGGDTDAAGVFGRSHVEHLEPYVLPQKLLEYACRYGYHDIRYFPLADTMTFRFTNGEPGRLVERHYRHRFAGPGNVQEFHDEMFRAVDPTSDGDSPVMIDDPNILVYRDFGYNNMVSHTVHYVSADGQTVVLMEMYLLHESAVGTGLTACERKFRIKIEHGDFWTTINSSIAGGDGRDRNTELVVGLVNGTTVAVTRSTDDGEFDATVRTPDGRLIVDDATFTCPDGRRVFECYDDKGVVTINVAGGSWIFVNYGDFDEFVCEIHVTDGTKFRILEDPLVEHCSAGSEFHRDVDDASNDPYVVCRRDLSGYEFVNLPDNVSDESTVRKFDERSPVTVVRTLTRSHFDDRTGGLVDKMLADHYETIKKLADKLNVVYLEDNIKFEPK